jgi:hypothetical protein
MAKGREEKVACGFFMEFNHGHNQKVLMMFRGIQ